MKYLVLLFFLAFLVFSGCNPAQYEYEYAFSTHEANTFECSLGKGDIVTAHIMASTEVSFYIIDTYNILIYDAGSITNHRFKLKAPKTSTYYLCFRERTYSSQVQLLYNSPTMIKDVTLKTFG